MSAPLVWIFLPALLSVALYFLRRWERAVLVGGILVTGLLAWIAWRIPIGETVSLARLPLLSAIRLEPVFDFLGRQFIIDNSSRPALQLIYLSTAFWFGGSYLARTESQFIPLSLAVTSLMVASLSVEPFLYAALLIEMAALVSVPILAWPGKPVSRGVLRFLIFQTLGVPFILLAGWLIPAVEANPLDASLGLVATVVISLGFALFSAVFPFHTWIPMVAEDAHPYAAAFVFFTFPGFAFLLGLGFLERYAWIPASPFFSTALQSTGILMVLIGGIWAAFQRNLGRLLGFTVLMEGGLALLSLGLSFNPANPSGASVTTGLGVFFSLYLPRALAVALWAIALAFLRARAGSLDFRSVYGLGRSMPVTGLSILLAGLCLAGFPLLAGFPVHLALWSALARQSPLLASLAMIGNLGLLAGILRSMTVLITGTTPEGWQITEKWPQISMMVAAWLLLFAAGLFPQWFLPALANMARIFGPPGS